MKKLVILVLAISMLATVAYAQEESKSMDIGARAGYSISPDQIFLGAHMDLGQLVGPMRLVPNFEIGFGNDMTVMCFNGDLIYDFADTPWSIGGELGLIITSWDDQGLNDIPGVDIDTSSSDIGLSVLGDYRLQMSNGKTLLLEGKLGLANSPDFKITVGYNFF